MVVLIRENFLCHIALCTEHYNMLMRIWILYLGYISEDLYFSSFSFIVISGALFLLDVLPSWCLSDCSKFSLTYIQYELLDTLNLRGEREKIAVALAFSSFSQADLERTIGNIQREAYAKWDRSRPWKYPREVHATEQLINVFISASQQEIWAWREGSPRFLQRDYKTNHSLIWSHLFFSFVFTDKEETWISSHLLLRAAPLANYLND